MINVSRCQYLDILSEYHEGKERSTQMAFSFKNSKGQTYFLHATTRVLKSGKEQHLYYFAKTQKAGVLNALPQGYVVTESKTGLPVLKKK
jgi:hypothetical protein